MLRARAPPLCGKSGWSTSTAAEFATERRLMRKLHSVKWFIAMRIKTVKSMTESRTAMETSETPAQVRERYGRKLRRAAEGRARDVEAILQRGADINYVSPSISGYVILAPNDTSLHAAAENGQKAVVDILIAAGADLDRRTVLEHSGRNTEDSAPIHVASKNGHEDILEALLRAGANVDLENGIGNTALHMAAAKGRQAALDILLHADAQVNLQSLSGQTPLHEAAFSGHENIVKTLLAAGGDPGIRNKRQETPLEAAKGYWSPRDEAACH